MNIDTLRRTFPTGELSVDNKAFVTRSATNSTTVATASDYVTWTLTTDGVAAQAVNEYDTDATDAIGTIASSLATTPAAGGALSVPANSQSVIYDTLTIQNTAGVTVVGELRVYPWL